MLDNLLTPCTQMHMQGDKQYYAYSHHLPLVPRIALWVRTGIMRQFMALMAPKPTDLVLDFGQAVELPVKAVTVGGGFVLLEEGSLDLVYANNVLEHVPDLPCLMTNLLALLKEDGILEIEVPYEKSPAAWQDPTHLRAMNQNSWVYYTDWFWYLGWFAHRFELTEFTWLGAELQPCEEVQAVFMRVKLRKIQTTPHERSIARVTSPDFKITTDDL